MEIYYLLVGKQYTVGRKNTNILISNDLSISRNHAILSLSHPESLLNNLERLPILTLKDSGSKYGTYVNDSQKVVEDVILKAGDKVTFGQSDASFQLFYEPIVITTSCIEREDKEQLKKLIQRLGGHLMQEWSKECTHLVMKELKVTIKAVCAMVSLKPLVTKQYFEQLILHIEENKNLPKHESYIPLLGEPVLDRDTATFHCKKERQVIFQNKIFVCTSQKQFKKLQLAIKLAGGKIILMGAENEITTSLILHADTCVMKYQSDSSQTFQPVPHYIAKIEEELKKNKKRMIPESDIGLAVVYCSTERYCNPDFSMASSLFAVSKLHSQTLSQQDVYVADTQSSTSRSSMDRSKSKYGSYVSDTLEKTKHEISFNIGHQDEVLSPTEPVSQHNGKRARHFSNSEHPPKQMKLQDMTIKKEDSSSEGTASLPVVLKDGQLAVISKVAVKTELVTPFDNKTALLEEQTWSEPAFAHPNQPSADALIAAVKEERRSKSSLIMKSSTTEECGIDENYRQQSEERITFSTSIDGFLSKISHNLATSRNSTIREEQIVDEDLPAKLLTVEFASLCPKRDAQPRWTTNCSNRTNYPINFKKFHKIYSTGNKLPVIIGGRDLVVYNKNTSKDLNSWLNDNPDTQSQENEEIGLFDWDSNKRSR